MNSVRSHEGIMTMDHRASPGIPDSIIVPQGLPPGSGQGLYEAATFTCSHCERVVAIVNQRKASEVCGYCTGCNHRLCTTCTTKRAKDGICLPFKVLAEQLLNVAAKVPATNVAFTPKLIIP